MKYIFLLILIISSILNATPVINIDSDTTQLKDFQLEYFVDKSFKMSLKEIKKQKFTEDRSTLSLGIFHENTWLRFKLHNSTNRVQKLYIHNENSYISNAISFYELLDNRNLSSLQIDFFNNINTEKMYGTDAIFTINLDINQTKTIYIQSVMMSMQYPHITIYNEVQSKKRVSQNNSLLFIILGMLIALAIYHAVLYITTKRKEYLYYTLYLVNAAIWESVLSGLLANTFAIYINSMSENLLLSVIFIPVFLTLFAKTIFETQKKYKKENLFLNSVIILSLFVVLIGLFNIRLALIITSLLFVYTFATIFITTYSIMKKGDKFALIFLVANTIFSIFMLITDLYYSGFINYSPFVFNSGSIGVVIEAVILSQLLVYRIKLLELHELKNTRELSNKFLLQDMNKELQLQVKKELEISREKDKILFQQNKMISMGEMIENIAHQWRQPLAEINASVFSIDTIIYDKYNSSPEIEKELIAIENLTDHMSKTIGSFQNYFNKSQEKKEFSLRSAIYEAIVILGKSLENNNVVINIEIEDDFIHHGFENELQQVILAILNNAKDALISNQIDDPKIEIKVTIVDNNYEITICDNAGGIKDAIMHKIFEPYFTTKHQTQGKGLGLYISKIIIEDKMHGTLYTKNIDKGTCFYITLKKESTK